MELDNSLASTSEPIGPFLEAAPGRCIIRIVPRIHEATVEGSALVAVLDGRYENQPMVGYFYSCGDPTNEREEKIKAWMDRKQAENRLFVFTIYGTGSPFWNDDMRTMLPLGYDFRWLQGMRLYDMSQIGAAAGNTGMYGEKVRIMAPKSLIEVVS